MSTEAIYLLNAIKVAKSMYEEYNELPWFKATHLHKINNDITVIVQLDSSHLENVHHLMTKELYENGIRVTFSCLD